MEQQEQQPLMRLISTVYMSPEGEQAVTYGIEVYDRGQIVELTDIDLSAAAVERLLERLRGADVAFCQLWEVVADYVAELSCG